MHHAQTWVDRSSFCVTKMQAYIAQNQLLAALQLAREALNHLGVPLPEQPTPADVAEALGQTQALLKGRAIESLLELPPMTAASPKAAMVILSNTLSAAYQVAPDLLPLLILAHINLSVQHGNAPESTYGYVMYGLMHCAKLNEIESGYRFGRLGVTLLQHLHAPKLQAKTIFGFHVHISHWKEPAKDTIPGFLQAYTSGLETGDLEYVALSLMCHNYTAFFTGHELASLRQTMEDHLAVMQQTRQDIYFRIQSIYYQTVLNLLEPTAEPDRLYSENYDEAAMIQLHLEANQALALFQLYFCKLLLSYVFQRYEQALENFRLSHQYLDAAAGLLHMPLFYFYSALVQLAVYPNAIDADKAAILEHVDASLEKLTDWAIHAPSNQAHRCALVTAERCRVLGQKAEASEHYDRAIAGAKAHEYIQEEALANELAAKFYLDWGKERLAQDYLIEAYYGYARWGAKAKVADLETRHPQLLAPILQQTRTPLSVNETVFAPGSITSNSSSSGVASSLDLAAILKASQTLSSEIELDKLLSTLLHTVIQTAGADKCVLMLLDNHDLKIHAIAELTDADQIETHIPLNALSLQANAVPMILVNTVKRNLEPAVIINAAMHPQFTGDVYIQTRRPKSLLCSPILHQGKLMGLVYLENNLATGAFTSDRVELLTLLCAQAAISLENARLYQQSQQALVQLRDNETRLQNLAANVPGMVYQLCLASDGSVSTPYVSSGCFDLYELDPDDVMTGKSSVYSMHHPEDNAVITQAMMESAQNLAPFTKEWRIITPSGKVKWLQAAARPERKADGSIVWDGVVLDVSDRKQAEAEVIQKSQELQQALTELQNTQLQMVQNEKMASLGNLVAGVAHEINNPIGFLNGSIKNAKDYVQDLFEHLELYQAQQPPNNIVQDNAEDIDIEFLLEDLPKLIDSMQGATDRIKGISTSLRTFSRADTQYKVRANLHEGLDSTLLILKYRLKANENRPEIEIIKDYGDLPEIECFPGQLNQVFMNILANAIDMFDEMAQQTTFEYLKNNPQQITIRIAKLANQNAVEIQISDNGKGMTNEVKSRIFDHLFTTKDVGKGTGLGLAIAHQIVTETHRGQLTVESELSQGSTFCICLPICAE